MSFQNVILNVNVMNRMPQLQDYIHHAKIHSDVVYI
jgi:hypothetical protein